MPDHEFLPPREALQLPHAGTYRRVLPVSLERLYENALDWQHLAHLHASSFASVRCQRSWSTGWQVAATATNGRDMVLELSLDRICRRWITRTLDGFGAGTEVWTHAFAVAPQRVDIVVDFFVPVADAAGRRRVGEAYARHYARLYDEDVAMMRERQHQLDRRVHGSGEQERTQVLGPRANLTLPREFELGGRDFVLAEVEQTLVAFPRQCPHQLGPLTGERLQGREVTCPWHGYRFDVVSGDNVSGGACRLEHLPEVTVDRQGMVRIKACH